MEQIRAQLLLYITLNTSACVSVTQTTVASLTWNTTLKAAVGRKDQQATLSTLFFSGLPSHLAKLLCLYIQYIYYSLIVSFQP